MHTKTRAISEGAMLLAVMGMVLLINRQLAGMLELLFLFLSLPIIVYTARYGMKMALTCSVAALLISVFLCSITSLFYMFCALCMGLLYGCGIRRRWRNQTLLAVVIATNVLSTYVSVILLSALFGYDIVQETQMVLHLLPATMESAALSQYVFGLVLLSYLLLALMQGVLIHVLAHQVLVRLHIEVRPLQTLYEVRFPKYTLALIGMGLACRVAVAGMTSPAVLKSMLLGVYGIAFLMAEVDGCIALLCKIQRRLKNKSVIFLLLMACFMPFLKELIAAYGIYDIYTGKSR